MLPTLRQHAIAAVPNLPFVEVRAFDETFLNLLKPWRLGATIFVLFGLLALLIGAVGLAVVTADSITRRTREIGIRSALGAEPGALVRLMLSRVSLAITAGVLVGIVGAWMGARALGALLFDVQPSDTRIFGTAIATLLGCGLLAAWVPARRAGRIDPVEALRAE
jgi:putative ABC transport system permease protein